MTAPAPALVTDLIDARRAALESAPAAPGPTRTDAILAQVKTVFAAKGFDGASMQDLARAAGMSAGNFYRYFASKDAIIAALVAQDLAGIERMFDAVMQHPAPKEAFMAAITRKLDQVAIDGEGAIWAEIEAAAPRHAMIGSILSKMETTVIDHQLRVFGRIAGIDPAEAGRRFAPHAALILLLIRGAAVSTCPRAGLDPRAKTPAMRDLVLRTISSLLSEISVIDGPTTC